MQREIPRLIECPPLTTQLQHLLTELVYLPNDPIQQSDCIFVFGNRHISLMAAKINLLLGQYVSPSLIISGGISPFEDSAHNVTSEAEDIYNQLIIPHPHSTQVQLESTSINTLENIKNSLNLFPPGMKTLTFVCNWYISRRARLTIFKFLPHNLTLNQFAISTPVPESDAILSPDTWFKTSVGKNRTFGEFIRLKTYGGKGDIYLDSETSDLLHQIDELV